MKQNITETLQKKSCFHYCFSCCVSYCVYCFSYDTVRVKLTISIIIVIVIIIIIITVFCIDDAHLMYKQFHHSF
jgi:hypothetical protein